MFISHVNVKKAEKKKKAFAPNRTIKILSMCFIFEPHGFKIKLCMHGVPANTVISLLCTRLLTRDLIILFYSSKSKNINRLNHAPYA